MRLLNLLIFSVCFWRCLEAVPAPDTRTNNSCSSNTITIPLVSFGKKNYYFGVNVLATYSEAGQFCREIGMELLKIESAEENDFLYSHIKNKTQREYFWTAGSKVLNKKNWIWMTSAAVVNYTNWGTGEPNNPNRELCLELWLFKNQGLIYNDSPCETKYSFICEKEKVISEVTQKEEITNAFSQNFKQIPFVTFGEKRYYFGDLELTFLGAEQFCRDIGMELVRIQSAKENDFLYKYIKEKTSADHFWTAGTKLVDKVNWIWITTGEFVTWTYWGNERPNLKDTELCLKVSFVDNKGLFLYNRPCNATIRFICEKHQRPLTQDVKRKNWASLFRHSDVYPRVNLLQFQEKSYYFGSHFQANFFEAAQFCRLINMRLISINSYEENMMLHKYIRDTSIGSVFFSSATKSIDGTTWVWLPTGKYVKYFNWKDGSPNKSGAWCMRLEDQKNTNLLWVESDCHDSYNFICENSDDFDPKPPKVAELYPEINVRRRRYRVSKNKATVYKAFDTCDSYGMELISIKDKTENDIVTRVVKEYVNSDVRDRYWTSGQKQVNGMWVWKNGQQPISYTNWDTAEPNNAGGKEECLHLYITGIWNDVPCSVEYNFICQYKNNEVKAV